jgi:hypothetical protein
VPRFHGIVDRDFPAGLGIVPDFVIALPCLAGEAAIPPLREASSSAVRNYPRPALCRDGLEASGDKLDLERALAVVRQKFGHHYRQFPLKMLNRIGLGKEADIADGGRRPEAGFLIPERFDNDFHGGLHPG